MQMNKWIKWFSVVFLIVAISAPVQAQDVIKQKETHSVFKGFFFSVWSRLRDIQPHQRQQAKSTTVYTAGIRGAESTETLLQPYWKGDLSEDKDFQAELKQFGTAQQLMDRGDLQASTEAFDVFIKQFANSNLLPNALFSKGLCDAALGNKEDAKTNITRFIEANPSHPLIADAKQVLSQLN